MSVDSPRKHAPCTPEEAVARAQRWAGQYGQYILGTGDYRPRDAGTHLLDEPWTTNEYGTGADCAGFAISYCWKLKRSQPGYNKGPWAHVTGSINSDSFLEDAQHHQELASVVDRPRPGDLLIYPSRYLGGKRVGIGHVGLVEAVPAEWDPKRPQYELLTILQCCGPNKRAPAVLRTKGQVWQRHDSLQPTLKTRIVRPHTRLANT